MSKYIESLSVQELETLIEACEEFKSGYCSWDENGKVVSAPVYQLKFKLQKLLYDKQLPVKIT